MRINGVHTYSTGTVLTHKQFKKVWEACSKTGCIEDYSDALVHKEKLYCYAFLEQGLKVYLSGKSGKLYRLRIQIEPCRVLGEQDPTALFQPGKKAYKELVKEADRLLKKLKAPCSVDDMKTSRCDLTMNIQFSIQKELKEYLRIFKKSPIIPDYKHVFFAKNDQKAKDCKAANTHSHRLSCKSASFLIYDKIAQLEMIGRCDETLLDKNILRLEAELKRPALKKHLGKKAMVSNREILLTAARKAPEGISWYVDRLQPKCEKYVRYKDAVEMIACAKLKDKTRDRMLHLLRKASNQDSLSTALADLRNEYRLSKSQCARIQKKSEKLGISPITLRNGSVFTTLPSLRI